MLFDISARKFRRWAEPKQKKPKVSFNKLLPYEVDAIVNAAFLPQNLGKPLSHIFVYGHNTGAFHTSLTTVYRYLKAENLVKPFQPRKKTRKFVSIQELLENFSVLVYDGCCFKTESGINVWSIPVMLLPYRYLLHIGYAIGGVSSKDIKNAVAKAFLNIPENFKDILAAFSDRGSAMKSNDTVNFLNNTLKIPIFFGRPQTPDDEGHIEAFNKTSKYHRDAPACYQTVSDVLNWFVILKDTYNNEPHSGINYVTPAEAFAGKKEEILQKRKENLIAANLRRLNAHRNAGLEVAIR